MDEKIWFPTGAQGKPGWSYQDAAARFFASKDEFLSISGDEANPSGQWDLACFAAKRMIGKVITEEHVEDLRELIESFRRCRDPRGKYYTVRKLEHPPPPLSVSQDRTEVARRAFATKMFWEGKGYNLPPKR